MTLDKHFADKLSDAVEFIKTNSSDPTIQSIEDEVQYFEVVMPTVMEALDMLAELHSFLKRKSSSLDTIEF